MNKDRTYLLDILDSGNAISQMLSGITFAVFQNDRKTRRAIERELEIICEAARRISEEFRINTQQIPWRQIIGMRNIISHDYGEIQIEILWKTAKFHIPDLILKIQELLNEHPNTTLND